MSGDNLFCLLQHNTAILFNHHFNPQVWIALELFRGITSDSDTGGIMISLNDLPILEVNRVDVIGNRLCNAPIPFLTGFEGALHPMFIERDLYSTVEFSGLKGFQEVAKRFCKLGSPQSVFVRVCSVVDNRNIILFPNPIRSFDSV